MKIENQKNGKLHAERGVACRARRENLDKSPNYELYRPCLKIPSTWSSSELNGLFKNIGLERSNEF